MQNSTGIATARKPSYDFLKRVVDILLSAFFLMICLQMFVLILILIKLDSPGPVIFSQRRTGKDGKEFRMFKFRTMYNDSDPYEVSPKSRQDPRITRAGGVLRPAALDEFPQLINVLLGSMSLVGPRPEMPFITEQYNGSQRRRLSIKPGITGLWQISAARSNPIHHNMEYDIEYIENRSVWLDISILWQTFKFVVKTLL